jgi:hypothetical protein
MENLRAGGVMSFRSRRWVFFSRSSRRCLFAPSKTRGGNGQAPLGTTRVALDLFGNPPPRFTCGNFSPIPSGRDPFIFYFREAQPPFSLFPTGNGFFFPLSPWGRG